MVGPVVYVLTNFEGKIYSSHRLQIEENYNNNNNNNNNIAFCPKQVGVG
jgi:hypothetical protein